MNVKLAHKWDTPATLGCSIDSVEFKPTTVHFEAKWNAYRRVMMCSPSTKKKFVLNLNLMGKINPEVNSWMVVDS